ncbi:acylphosphatase [Aspergillus tubingensis]|uniref:acylphosphatase n=1 Tax=Aspergillus tubingensis TaxID=5068 RepID=UPI001577EB7F|nr:acylphosphatase [Aspergillus tubingensis]GFN16972.1 acylphosphatase [Aspergillus tubingensis]
MASQRIAFKVSGTVQGKFTSILLSNIRVGFRDFTQKRATAYDVKGWVKNTHCGRVEGEAQGTEDSLQKFLKDINNGPRHAHVVKLEKKEIAPKDGEVEFGFMKTSESGYEAMQ